MDLALPYDLSPSLCVYSLPYEIDPAVEECSDIYSPAFPNANNLFFFVSTALS
jgi:hypothetical protein